MTAQTASNRPSPGREPLPLPRTMHLTLTNVCNLNCVICRPEDFRYKAEYLTRPVLERIVAESFDSLTELRLDSGGELLLNKELPYVLAEATRRNIGTKICSNAVLMDDAKAEMICRSSVTNVQISLDSPDKDTLEWIRTRAKFEKVIAGAERLVHWRNKVGSTLRINFHAAVMRQNLEQLPDLIRLAKKIGVDDVTFAYGFIHSYMDPDWAVFWDQDGYREVMREVRWLCDDLGIGYNAPPDFGQPVLASRRCDYLFEKTYVNADGLVAPCCIAPEGYTGNLHEQSLTDIWHGDTYRAFRETYDSAAPALQKCGACYIMQGWDPDDFRPHFHPDHYPYVEARLNGASAPKAVSGIPITMFKREGETAVAVAKRQLPTLGDRRMLIFGAGAGGHEAYETLKLYKLDGRVVGVVDNDPAKQGAAFHGFSVQRFDDVAREQFDYVVIASPGGKVAISAQLEEAGLTVRQQFGTLAFVRDILGPVPAAQARVA